LLETKCEESLNTTRETWCELAMVEIGEVYKEKSSGHRTEPWGRLPNMGWGGENTRD